MKQIGAYSIRPPRPQELQLMPDFLYEAIFQRPGEPPLPREIIHEPQIWAYVDAFGSSPHDHCLVAEQEEEGQVAGMVWARILGGPVPGFGHVDEATPELALAVLPAHRRRGLAAALLEQMQKLLRDKGYQQVSLAVQKDNFAVDLYRKVGFTILRELPEEYLMLCPLTVE